MSTPSSKISVLKAKLQGLFRLKYLLLWMALGCFLLTRFLYYYPQITERWYSRGLYPYIARALTMFSDNFLFSLTTFSAGLLAFILIVLLLLFIFGLLRLSRVLLIIFNLSAFVYLAFYWLWGFNYYREPLYSRFDMVQCHISDLEYEDLVARISKKANELKVPLDSLSIGKLDTLVDGAFRLQAGYWALPWLGRKIHPKQMMAESWMAKASIYGYYGPFFNEIHVSRISTRSDYPLLLAHERVHRLGITGESEANFYAWLLCYKSGSPELQYAADLFLLRHLFDAGYGKEFMKPVEQDSIQLKMNELETGWFTRLTDRFLKWNKVENGLSDYGRVIEPAANYLIQIEKWNDEPKIEPVSKKGKRKFN
ncbi:MAG: DUF3810 family protein [Mangrovibacterium sp.]